MVDHPQARQTVGRAVVLIGVLGGTMFLSYGLMRETRNAAPGVPVIRAPADTSRPAIPFASGKHLVAYMLLSADCGFCTEKVAKQAISRIRDSLRASQEKAFVHISVVAVLLDDDIRAGIKYAESLNSGFDELSIGGSWLNEHVIRLIWRDALATPQIPQVLLFERPVDASAYPRSIDVQRDSLVLSVAGRSDLIDWVNAGAPLDFRRKRPLGVQP
ncbi:MAG: hypothetical protein HOP28_03520 [Gemmatimonadales bacterium]|nr:hypothetical protein [Gemmatimonadales bacterium]